MFPKKKDPFRIFEFKEIVLFGSVLGAVFLLVIPSREARGDLACRAFEYDRAVTDYKKALEETSAAPGFTKYLPETLRRAVDDFLLRQYTLPRKRRLIERLVTVSGYTGRRREFLRYAKLLTAYEPGNERVRERLIEGYVWNESIDDAVRLLKETLDREGFNVKLALQLADLYLGQGRVRDALPLLEKALEMKGDEAIRRKLANAYHTLFYEELKKRSEAGGGEE